MKDDDKTNESCSSQNDCPYIPDKRFIDETLVNIGEKLDKFEKIIADLTNYRNKLTGAVFAISAFISILVNVLWNMLRK